MKSFVIMAGSTILVSAALVAGAIGADNENLSIKQVMGKLNKGPQSTSSQLKTALAADKPNWDAIQKSTDEYLVLTEVMAKQTPKKGDKSSWTKQAERYIADAKALDDAAKAKDLEAARAAHQKLGASCKACHKVHK